MIKVENLNKKFSDVKALKNASFEIEKGDVISIIGPSGSGKTTLLRCMNFLTKADSGTLIFDSNKYDLSNIHHKDVVDIRSKTGFVFQNYNLFLNKTALENVIEALIVVKKMNRNKAIEIGMKMLKKVGLENKANNYPIQLSGGQQQRVAIARALALDPEIIYFDEPTSALDPELINEVLYVMQDLAKDGMTMLVVTHEMNFAKNASNKVIFMEDGEIIEYNDTKVFFENPSSERAKVFIKNVMER